MLSIKNGLTSVLLSLGLLCSPFGFLVPVSATILFAGGEDIDFTMIGDAGLDTTSGRFHSGYAREAIHINPSSGDPAINRAYTPTFTASTTIWLHAQVWQSTNATGLDNQTICAFSPDGVCRILIRGTGVNQQVKLSKRTSAGVFTDLVTCAVGAIPRQNTLVKLDWQIFYNSSGSTTLYINGVNVCTYSGDVTTNSTTQLNQLYFGGTGVGGTETDWSEVIVADTDTRDMNLFTCAPQANGTTQNWTGTASNVNPVAINDAAAINTTSTGTIGNFTCPSLASGSFTVPAVIQSARVQGASGLTNFRFNSRPAGAGSDFDTTSDIPVIGVFQNYPNNIITTNPNTSSAWTTGNLGAGVNFGVKSRP